MRTATLWLMAAAGTGLFAQAPSQLRLPKAIGHIADPGSAAPAVPGNDGITRYASRREAAIAALKAGNEAAVISRGPERPLGLFLLAARRDPTFATALFNVGVMCTRQERWEDALNFYKEAASLDNSADMRKTIQAEIARVQSIAALDGTAEGRRTRQFDIEFVKLAGKHANPGTLEEALQLAKTDDANRWELQALIGSLQAAAGKYDESAKALDAAGKLAPGERRRALASASDLARREATFEDLLRTADENWEKQQYSAAAKAYANAWETSAAREKVGMQAATAFLMADDLPLAVQTLAKLRDTGGPDLSVKAGLMLKELGAVSEEAKQLAQMSSSSGRPESTLDIGERIQALLGDLTSPEMQLAAKENPPLVLDETRFVGVDDVELTSNSADALLLSTQSVFQLYRRAVPSDQVPSTPPADFTSPVAPGGGLPALSPEVPPAAIPPHPQKLDTRPTAAPESDHAALIFRHYAAFDSGGAISLNGI